MKIKYYGNRCCSLSNEMAKPHDIAVLYVKTLFTTTFMNIKDYISVDVNGILIY